MLPDGWLQTTIGEQVTLQRGVDITKAEQRPGIVPVLSSGGISSYHDTAAATGPGVVLGRKGVVGSVFYVQDDYWPHDTTLWVKDFKGNHPHFVYYFFRAFAGTLARMDVGSANPTLNRNHVHPIEVVWPKWLEQRAIAAVLGSLDDKIEQNRRTGAKLEGLARAVFKAWFVDFEPVKAKAASATAFPGMPPETFAALPTRIEDSALGPVPQGWKVAAIGDALTLSKQQINPQDHADEMFDHYSIPAFDAGQNAVVEPGGGIKSQKFVVVPGCVLLSKLNPRIARVWLPPAANERRQIASTEFLVAVPRPGWTREFLFCLFLQDEFRDSLAQSASGTSNSHQRVRPGDLLTRPLVVPSTAMREAFADQVVPQIQLRAALHFESAKLATLRDYLLPRLLSGRVRVRGEIT